MLLLLRGFVKAIVFTTYK